MEDPNRLEHLRTKLEELDELSNELTAPRNSLDGDSADLGAASDLFTEYRKTLRARYEHLKADSETH